MTVITVSRKELTRLRVLIDIGDGRLSVEDATPARRQCPRCQFSVADATP